MRKKVLSLVAVLSVVSMTVTSVLPAAAAPDSDDSARAADLLENQVLDLEFDGNLTDGTGTNSGISIQGTGFDYVDGVDGGQALSLTGNAYVNLGEKYGFAAGKSDAVVLDKTKREYERRADHFLE